MPTAVSTAFGTGITGIQTNITDLLSANLGTVLSTAGILIAVGIVWRFSKRAVRG